jgi:hypothetical protein
MYNKIQSAENVPTGLVLQECQSRLCEDIKFIK